MCGARMLVHGGWNGRARLADVHILDISERKTKFKFSEVSHNNDVYFTENMCWIFMSSFMSAASARLSPVKCLFVFFCLFSKNKIDNFFNFRLLVMLVFQFQSKFGFYFHFCFLKIYILVNNNIVFFK